LRVTACVLQKWKNPRVFVVPTPKPANINQHTAQAASNAIAFRKNTANIPTNSYTMMVAGRKLYYDTYNQQIRRMSLSSDLAGILSNQEVAWESPAGVARGNIRNAIRLETNFTKRDRDELYKNQINFFTQFSDGTGTYLFGDKTLLTKPSAFDRINVRRVFIAIEKAIAQAARFSLFEFNDEFTRSQFVALVEPFLRDVKGRRGIFDYRVVCDDTNNTPEIIDSNQFVGDIYIKPARSINFIQLNFVAVRTGVAFSEIVGQF
jgi:phage tail sheath protein FI